MNHEEKQIREAFIDGFISGHGGFGETAEVRREAERAWRDENTTERAPRRRRTRELPPNHPSNRRVGDPPGRQRTMC